MSAQSITFTGDDSDSFTRALQRLTGFEVGIATIDGTGTQNKELVEVDHIHGTVTVTDGNGTFYTIEVAAIRNVEVY